MGGAFLKSTTRADSTKSFHLPTVLGQFQPLDISVKMAKTFHQFTKLPPEIRHKIWEAAVRPFDIPGVHFFSVEFRNISDSSDELQIIGDDIPVPALSRVQSAVFASPDRPHKCSWWDHANASSHFIDGGLWTACQESNTIIGRLYRKCQPTVWFKGSSLSKHRQVKCILPQLDLICLTRISGLLCPEKNQGPTRMLGIDIRRTRSRLNIAFDMYSMDIFPQGGEHEWPWTYLQECIKGLIDCFQALPPLKIWLLDRQILLAKASEGGELFEGHQNLRLVEIFAPTKARGRHYVVDSSVTGEWALSQARRINEARWRYAVTVGGESFMIGPKVGVLAVEDRE